MKVHQCYFMLSSLYVLHAYDYSLHCLGFACDIILYLQVHVYYNDLLA